MHSRDRYTLLSTRQPLNYELVITKNHVHI